MSREIVGPIKSNAEIRPQGAGGKLPGRRVSPTHSFVRRPPYEPIEGDRRTETSPLQPNTHDLTNIRFGHDFGRMRVFAAAPPETIFAHPSSGDAERQADRVAAMHVNRAGPVDSGAGSVPTDWTRPSMQSLTGHPSLRRHLEAVEGSPLSPDVRSFFEPRLGSDLRAVRVHSDPSSAAMAASLNARAFTVGGRIFFNRGELDAQTGGGRALLMHELVHTLQQGRHDAGALQRKEGDSLQFQSSRFKGDPVLETILAGAEEMSEDKNSEGMAVRRVQQALMDAGYLRMRAPTGKFDAPTKGAVKLFQLTAGLNTGLNRGKDLADGVVRALTMQRLDQIFPASPTKTGTAPPVTEDFRVLHLAGSEDLMLGLAWSTFFFEYDSVVLADRERERVHVLSDPEKKKRDTSGLFTHDDKPIELIGYASEEGPPAHNRDLARKRAAAVGEAFKEAGHKSTRDLKARPEDGIGQLDYRQWRRTDVMPPGTADKMGKGGTTAKKNDCESPVKDALKKADEMLGRATDRLEKNDKSDQKAISQALAPFGGPSVIPKLLPKLKALREHLNTNVVANHSCKDSRDQICGPSTMAYNVGVGSSANMSVCPPFTAEKNLVIQAGFLIHEATHGTTDIQSSDFARRFHRAFLQLDQDVALRNADSYAVLAHILGADDTTVEQGRPSTIADKIVGLKDKELEQASRAVGIVEIWAGEAAATLAGVYVKLLQAQSEKKWTITPYMYMMNILAPRFGLSRPPVVPTERDRTAVAAIHDRYRSMSERVTGTFSSNPLTLTRGTGSTDGWKAGSADQPRPGMGVTFADDFYAQADRHKQVLFLFRKLVEATPDISPKLHATYVEVADLLRQAIGFPDS